MKEILLKKSTIILVVFALAFVFLNQAHAGTAVLTLKQNSLNNVNDAAGIWQYAGGKVFITDTHDNISAIAYIADYAITRRTVTAGTDAQNAAMLTMTIFFIGNNPSGRNITLQGSHSYSTGNYFGSVSAASSGLTSLIGATFSGTSSGDTGTLSITY